MRNEFSRSRDLHSGLRGEGCAGRLRCESASMTVSTTQISLCAARHWRRVLRRRTQPLTAVPDVAYGVSVPAINHSQCGERQRFGNGGVSSALIAT